MGFFMISNGEMDRLLESGKTFALIDLREKEAYARERIEGSRNIPFQELWERQGEVPRDMPVLFYCDRGSKSMVACREFSRRGVVCASLGAGIRNYRGKFIDRRPLGAIE